MKVVMINGSRRENGCTYTALSIIAEVLNDNEIDVELFNIGPDVMNGDINEAVQEVAESIKTADGLIVGSPVYYASPSGEVISFLDRLFGVALDDLCFKPAAAITSARRAGTTATLEVLNKYFQFAQMPIVSSSYWPMVHGNTPDQIFKDEEGIDIMKTLGRNMAWILKSIEAGKAAGVAQPVGGERPKTNFIR
ncbi:MAG: flavodoxin family protein [Eubacteriales bacterium]|nr:flavodoxin family protein [Eubacteriales bacterium]